MKNAYLTIFSMDFLGVRFDVGGTPCQIRYD